MLVLPGVLKMVTQHPHLAICPDPFWLVVNPTRTHTVKRDRNTEKCFSESTAEPRLVTRVEHETRETSLCLEL